MEAFPASGRRRSLHSRHREDAEAYATEVYGSVCRVSRRREKGCGMLSDKKSVGKQSCLVAAHLPIFFLARDLHCLCRHCAGNAYRQPVSCKHRRQRRQRLIHPGPSSGDLSPPRAATQGLPYEGPRVAGEMPQAAPKAERRSRPGCARGSPHRCRRRPRARLQARQPAHGAGQHG